MLWAVIMAGGSGTRFWPVSRHKSPKQFSRIFGKTSLFEETLARIRPLISKSQILVVTQDFNLPLAKRLSRLPSSQLVGEPVGRNTAPCAVYAAAKAFSRDPNAVIALLPADQRIAKVKIFQKALKTAFQIACSSSMPVTFGIRPIQPHTGYGYLEMGRKIDSKNELKVHRLKRFCEKPDLKTAVKFLKTGRFLWNSGIFVWKAEPLLEVAKKYLPQVYALAMNMVMKPSKYPFRKNFSKMPNISIDYGIMERLKGDILTLPLDIGWSDLGSWPSCAELWTSDPNGNAYEGLVLFHKSQGNLVKTKKLTVLLGVKDLVVIETGDALLVCSKAQSESIKEAVQILKSKNLTQYL